MACLFKPYVNGVKFVDQTLQFCCLSEEENVTDWWGVYIVKCKQGSKFFHRKEMGARGGGDEAPKTPKIKILGEIDKDED